MYGNCGKCGQKFGTDGTTWFEPCEHMKPKANSARLPSPLRWLLAAALFSDLILHLSSCGLTAQGDSATAVSFQGSDGSTCYVIYDSGRAVGGNCK